MPPTDRFVTCFAAEPPQEPLARGAWAERLGEEFLAACLRVDSEGEDLGDPGPITWYPDRTWNARTYVPATSQTANGFELYGHVSFERDESSEPVHFESSADFTAETAAENPDWALDLCEDVIGHWRGEKQKVAQMTLVWGRPIKRGGFIVTGELADLVVDQCYLNDGLFTLIAPDDYRGDILDIKLYGPRGGAIASESLYEDDGE